MPNKKWSGLHALLITGCKKSQKPALSAALMEYWIFLVSVADFRVLYLFLSFTFHIFVAFLWAIFDLPFFFNCFTSWSSYRMLDSFDYVDRTWHSILDRPRHSIPTDHLHSIYFLNSKEDQIHRENITTTLCRLPREKIQQIMTDHGVVKA